MSALKPVNSDARARLPRVTFDTRHGDTADGLHVFSAAVSSKGKRYDATSSLQDMILEKRVETTVFGHYIILMPGTKVTVKTLNANRGTKQTSALFNSPQWEATYQNIAWEHGIAPQVYGYDDDQRIIVMQPMHSTLQEHIRDAKQFSKEMQLKYLKLVHTLDIIQLEHRDLRANHVLLDATGAMYVGNFARARHLTETVSAKTRRNANVRTCLARFGVSIRTVNKESGVDDIITPLLERLSATPDFDIAAYIVQQESRLSDGKSSQTKNLYVM